MKRWLIPLAAICALLLAGEWFARTVLGLATRRFPSRIRASSTCTWRMCCSASYLH